MYRYLSKKFVSDSLKNPYATNSLKEIKVGSNKYKYYNIHSLGKNTVDKIPYSVRVLLESALRNCNEFDVKSKFIFLIKKPMLKKS